MLPNLGLRIYPYAFTAIIGGAKLEGREQKDLLGITPFPGESLDELEEATSVNPTSSNQG